eukprot:TRINITY_DN13878_c0_g2_i3.p1 TRINITY_DN13878_c0_g2~~TRINITY_DN13878_c0_g2_i3.p1  ORF type:complete len:119 (+),score=1.58 TRINITY_DN13878_c0_g2_i3:33-359(+)
MGLVTKIPCFGVAKTLLHVEGAPKAGNLNKEFEKLGGKNLVIPLTASGVLIGNAFRGTKADDSVYVSCGHLIDQETSLAIVRTTYKKGGPEPVNQADGLSRKYLQTKY